MGWIEVQRRARERERERQEEERQIEKMIGVIGDVIGKEERDKKMY